MEKSWGEEKATDAIAGESEGWRGVKEKKSKGECERSVAPGSWPSVCFCGYRPLHCLLA